MKKVFLFFLLNVIGFELYAQTLAPSVINSTGGEGSWAGGTITYSVGEPVIVTGSSPFNFLTQGFMQPMAGEQMVITVRTGSAACKTSDDGYAAVSVSGGASPYTYNWSLPNSVTDSISRLTPGSYTIAVTDAFGNTVTQAFTIGALSDLDCEIHEYTGITPNNDGKNDFWFIERINLFPENTVRIFNRWGDKVWEVDGYNNTDKAWTGNNESGQPLPSGTYFYVINLNNKTLKGWVELTR